MSKITVNGQQMTAPLTGGALLRFKRETGRDFLKRVADTDVADIITLAWCAAKPPGIGLEEFADSMTLPEINALSGWLVAEMGTETETAAEGDGKKKD